MTYWACFTRLGEAQIVLPVVMIALYALTRHPQNRLLALCWMTVFAIGIAITIATKVAFLGWGIGLPRLDFTGISGHAVLAAAVYPLLVATLVTHDSAAVRGIAFAGGIALALLIGASRVIVDAHSVSEVVAGLLVGAATNRTAWAMAQARSKQFHPSVALGIAIWLVIMPMHAPPAKTHSAIVWLAGKLSGRMPTVGTRTELTVRPSPTAFRTTIAPPS